MKYVKVTIEWMSAHGLLPLPTMRINKDGSEVLLHEEYVAAMGADMSGLTAYAHNSAGLVALLSSPEWAIGDGVERQPSAGYVTAAAARNLMAATRASIQSLSMTGDEALDVADLFPGWEAGIAVKTGERYNHGGSLWECVQAHTTQDGWQPGTATLALWCKVQAWHAGTEDDPIPWEQGMALEAGKWYEQHGTLYVALQDSGALPYDLSQVPALARPAGEGDV